MLPPTSPVPVADIAIIPLRGVAVSQLAAWEAEFLQQVALPDRSQPFFIALDLTTCPYGLSPVAQTRVIDAIFAAQGRRGYLALITLALLGPDIGPLFFARNRLGFELKLFNDRASAVAWLRRLMHWRLD